MGIIIGKFRKNKTTVEVLEKLNKEIKDIEDYGKNTEERQKKIVSHFLVISIGIYFAAASFFYFYFYPTTFKGQLLYFFTPLLLAPFLIFVSKRVLTWYYNGKLHKNRNKLVKLREDKKKILEKVMDTETYKVARTILEKYAPDQVKKVNLTQDITPNRTLTTPGLRQRVPLTNPKPIQSRVSFGPAQVNLLNSPPKITTLSSANNQIVPSTPRMPMVRSILPRDRSVFDKMVEYLVGDGPSNRYALICQHCSSHNGMALKEEFEYVSFHCCYCYGFNPSRKKRPVAPKLEFTFPTESSDSEKNSGSDSESELENSELKRIEMVEEKETKVISDDKQSVDSDKLSDLDMKNGETEIVEGEDTNNKSKSDLEDFK